jgi:putative glutathione S-transferase
MGLLVEGKWTDLWYETKSSGGRFIRKESTFRDWVRADGSTAFAPEADRYHLYVSLACPWAHRTLLYRSLKKLEAVISVSVVEPRMADDGWVFGDAEGAVPDDVNGAHFLHQIYTHADSEFSGRVTVPVLWDRKTNTIVNNESSEIIRMFNSEFHELNAVSDTSVDFYPEALQSEIDELNDYIYPRINNGVYRCGFATTQQAYEEAYHELFEGLDEIDSRLATRRYLLGDPITEADWRLFTTLVRFDAVYVGHFKCNKQRIADYPNLSGYLRDLYQIPGVADTVNMNHIKNHYYQSHGTINPTGVVPVGPELDFEAPPGRESL